MYIFTHDIYIYINTCIYIWFIIIYLNIIEMYLVMIVDGKEAPEASHSNAQRPWDSREVLDRATRSS